MSPFATRADIRTALTALPGPDRTAIAAAQARNAVLTKPEGALGRLEDVAVFCAGWLGTDRPRIGLPQILVFAGNHGIAARGVSAYPAEVTAQMVANFESGGAAISQLAQVFGAALKVVPLDLDRPTADFTEGPAMREDEMALAFGAGWDAVDPAADLVIAGEMGIGNTTAAAAVAAALFGGDFVGAGTGVTGAALDTKRAAVAAGLARHRDALGDPLEVMRRLGGRELAAMAGAVLRARHLGRPVILDGFIATTAAAVLEKQEAGALDHCLAGHVSAEAGHGRLLRHLGKEPLLSLGLRLGEASGAALALAVVQGALACHSGMASFAEAGVSEG